MNLDTQNVSELVIGVATIGAAVFFVHTGAIAPEWGFGVVLAVASALTAYESGRKQPQPGESSDEEQEQDQSQDQNSAQVTGRSRYAGFETDPGLQDVDPDRPDDQETDPETGR